MTIEVVNNINKKIIFKGNRDSFGGLSSTDKDNNNVSFKKYNIPPKTDKKLERKVFATTLLGVSTALALLMKYKRGLSLNPAKIFSVPMKEWPKKWGLFNVKEYNELSITAMATGSILGGLIGGSIFDKKENKPAKIREAVIQMFGNILTPVAFVSSGSRLYLHFKDAINSKVPVIKNETKLAKYANAAFRAVPAFGIIGTFLAGGIISGNIIGNTINNKCFDVKEKRKVKLADFSAHIDDICLASSLVAAGGPLAFLTKIVPGALMVAGISTGVAGKTDGTNEKAKDGKNESINKTN